jgi:hypothetical protein
MNTVTAPFILKFSTKWRSVINITHQPLEPRKKDTGAHGQVGFQSRSGSCGKLINILLLMRFQRRIVQPVAISLMDQRHCTVVIHALTTPVVLKLGSAKGGRVCERRKCVMVETFYWRSKICIYECE